MRKPVLVRVKVEDELRSQFKAAAWRSHHHPSQVLRLLMEKYVEVERDRFGVDLTVWSNIRRVAEEVVPEVPAPGERVEADEEWVPWESGLR